MRRKFSFDIPKLKIASTKPEQRSTKEQASSPLDSPSTLPKSIRPPLPIDIDTELRAACAYVFYNHRPSHIKYEAPAEDAKPHNGYNVIKAGLEAFSEPSTDAPTGKYSYKPNVATEDLFKNDRAAEVPTQKSAKLRASHVPEVSRPAVVTTRARADSHPRLHTHAPPPTAHAPKQEVTLRPKIPGRTDSMGTVGSTPHTDSTEEVWSSSTRITSAAGTPAITSKRTSSQTNNAASESGSIPHIDASEAEWMLLELEKHRKAIEGKERAQEWQSSNTRHSVQPVTTDPELLSSSRLATRKPVVSTRLSPGHAGTDTSRPATRQEKRASSRAVTQQDSREVSRPATGQGLPSILRPPRNDTSRPDTSHTSDKEARGRGSSRPNSRADQASRAASRARELATSKAKEMTNGIIGHFRPDSSPGPWGLTPRSERTRSSSRTRTFLSQAKEYIRPSSAMSRRKESDEVNRGDRWSQSIESFHTGYSDSLRPTSASSSRLPPHSRDGRASPPRHKTAVDLNRELPPLPSLDKWHAEEAKQQASGAMNQTGPWLSTRIPTNEEIRASRIGSSPSNRPQRPSVDVRSIQSNAYRSGPSSALSPNTLNSSVGSDGEQLSAVHDGMTISVGTASKFYLPRERASQAFIRPDPSRASSSHDPHPAVRPRHISQMQRINIEDYGAIPEPHQQNVSAAISATPGPVRPSKDDKPKRKWWQAASSKDKRTSNWVERSGQSGATNDALLTEEGASAPIVRY